MINKLYDFFDYERPEEIWSIEDGGELYDIGIENISNQYFEIYLCGGSELIIYNGTNIFKQNKKYKFEIDEVLSRKFKIFNILL